MGLAEIKKRVERARQHSSAAGVYRHIKAYIAAGKYYDELTDEDKNLYCEYLERPREGYEVVNRLVYGHQHVKLEQKQPPPTEAELEETRQYIKEYLKSGYKDESEDITQ